LDTKIATLTERFTSMLARLRSLSTAYVVPGIIMEFEQIMHEIQFLLQQYSDTIIHPETAIPAAAFPMATLATVDRSKTEIKIQNENNVFIKFFEHGITVPSASAHWSPGSSSATTPPESKPSPDAAAESAESEPQNNDSDSVDSVAASGEDFGFRRMMDWIHDQLFYHRHSFYDISIYDLSLSGVLALIYLIYGIDLIYRLCKRHKMKKQSKTVRYAEYFPVSTSSDSVETFRTHKIRLPEPEPEPKPITNIVLKEPITIQPPAINIIQAPKRNVQKRSVPPKDYFSEPEFDLMRPYPSNLPTVQYVKQKAKQKRAKAETYRKAVPLYLTDSL